MAQILNPLTLPLQGKGLIEASAGTGKTYTLAALYIRLLLGHQIPAPLGVEQILVVTFTEAATMELRERIRSRIRDAREDFLRGSSDDPLLRALLEELPEHSRCAGLLESAATAMDQAAIFTIHGFCQRMLHQHAFESGALFHQTLTTDSQTLLRQAVLDFWRRRYYHAPHWLASQLLAAFKTPAELSREIQPLLSVPDLILSPDYRDYPLDEKLQAFLQQQDAFKAQWLAEQSSFIEQLNKSKLDGRKYRKDYLAKWLAAIEDYCTGKGYNPPWDQLVRFSTESLTAATKAGEPPVHALCEQIDVLFNAQVPVKEVLTAHALMAVQDNLRKEKARSQQLTFDDLLGDLAHALRRPQGGHLADVIRNQYPVALIDEFQDTDPLQYDIFSRVYASEEATLLMIGDPKQSIYAFRGADIFTYIRARREVPAHYTLDTNWRSSTAMVDAVNQLFLSHPAPFFYNDDIPFTAVNAAGKADQARFTCQGHTVPPLTYWVHSDALGKTQYRQQFAHSCAAQISALLHSTDYQLGEDAVQPGDIAVLVRDRIEAQLIQRALLDCGVASVFMSNRDSVFATVEARELLSVLQAVTEPTDERLLRSAMATQLFGYSLVALDTLFNDELAWEQLVEEFLAYRQYWQKQGVLPMLHQLLSQRQLAAQIRFAPQGERRLTDLLHLGELLQEHAQASEGLEGTLRWLADHIAEPNQQADEQQLRLESDQQRVTVITIHKSKGLEYALVFLPFVCNFRKSSGRLYHDQDTRMCASFSDDETINAQIQQESLAEDMRLLYVALTRAVHACFLGIADVREGNSKRADTHLSAMGALLLNDEQSMPQAIDTWAQQHAALCQVVTPPTQLSVAMEHNPPAAPTLQARIFAGLIDKRWRVTSYSALSQRLAHDVAPFSKLDLEVAGEDIEAVEDLKPEEMQPVWDMFHFPKGANAGTFLHTLFEEIDFSAPAPVLQARLPGWLDSYSFDAQWQPVLERFVAQVLATPLTDTGFSLSQIRPQDRQVEMAFFLPFAALQAAALNTLLTRFDPATAQAPQLQFEQVQGMLKGFIDLVVRYEGRYYVIDYKSNYLGGAYEDYTREAMQAAIWEHRYDLQYLLYSVAVHRLLMQRIPDYEYDRHFGGVSYLFLRGMQPGKTTGIYSARPPKALVEALDVLLRGEKL